MALVEEKNTDKPMDPQREELQSLVKKASGPISHYWPMKTFIHHNPLHGLEGLHFEEGIKEAEKIFRGDGYLQNKENRIYYKKGRITEEALNNALNEVSKDASISLGGKNVSHHEFLKTIFINGTGKVAKDASAAVFKSQSNQSELQSLIDALQNSQKINENKESLKDYANRERDELATKYTLAEWCEQSLGTKVRFQINNEVIKWVSGFLDEGHAHWSMPMREKSFYANWKELAVEDTSGSLSGIPDWRNKIKSLPDLPEDTISQCMSELSIPKDLWVGYFSLHLSQLAGWTGFLKWRSEQVKYEWQNAFPIDLTQYLAVRVFYEKEMIDLACRTKLDIPGTYNSIKDFLEKNSDGYGLYKDSQTRGLPEEIEDSMDLSIFDQDPLPINDLNQTAFSLVSKWEQVRNQQEIVVQALAVMHLAKYLNVTVQDIVKGGLTPLNTLIGWAEEFPESMHGPVWLKALESSFINGFVKRFSPNIENLKKIDSGEEKPLVSRPFSQTLFCIDVRSENFRRKLEEIDDHETFGYAGFFGIPLCYQGFSDDYQTDQCPVLLIPNNLIIEKPRDDHAQTTQHFLERKKYGRDAHTLLHDLKENVITPYIMVEAIGWFFGFRLFGQTLHPKLFNKGLTWLKKPFKVPLGTSVIVEKKENTDVEKEGTIQTGFNLDEQTRFVENAIRILGFTTFSRLILLCGHASTSDNNPFESALDCGACGGNHGSANARALAVMANNPEVRKILAEKGLEIPADTHFLPAQHDTTTDEIAFFDLENLPATHQQDLSKLQRDLKEAGEMNSRERLTRMPDEPELTGNFNALNRAKIRSMDWSQVRPEWGLSGHTAFIAGRRKLTQGMDLEGRTFLHSYDSSKDPEGNALEVIMTAPMIVGQWINMEHYFSTVDVNVYGAGSKAYHNVVGNVGVMFGTQSDLSIGLPFQTVMDGEKPYHEPMRLFVIIEAPRKLIDAIISKHEMLQGLIGNQWLHIVSLDREDMEFYQRQPTSGWNHITR